MEIEELFRDAKELLKGNWLVAIVSNIIVSLFVFIVSFIFIILIVIVFEVTASIIYYYNDIDISRMLVGECLLYIVIVLLPILFNSFMYVGYRFSILDALITKRMSIVGFFKIFNEKPIKVLRLLCMQGLFTFLWLLLCIVPGVIKIYSYSQALYILRDNPDFGVLECIRKSKKIMKGHKGTLFFSMFIIDLVYVIPVLIMSAGIDYGTFNYYEYNEPTFEIVYFIGVLLYVLVAMIVTPYRTSLQAVFYQKRATK